MADKLDRPYIGVIAEPHASDTSTDRLQAAIEGYRQDRKLATAVEQRFEGGTMFMLIADGEPAGDALRLVRQLDALVIDGSFHDRHAAAGIIEAAWDAGVHVYAPLDGQLVRCARPADVGLPPVEKLTGRRGDALVFHPGREHR